MHVEAGLEVQGKSLWRTFWVGDTIRGDSEDRRMTADGLPVFPMAQSMIWGVTIPWNLIASIGIGVWLMFAPAVFASSGRASDSDHLADALIVTTAAIATAEVTRAGLEDVDFLLSAEPADAMAAYGRVAPRYEHFRELWLVAGLMEHRQRLIGSHGGRAADAGLSYSAGNEVFRSQEKG